MHALRNQDTIFGCTTYFTFEENIKLICNPLNTKLVVKSTIILSILLLFRLALEVNDGSVQLVNIWWGQMAHFNLGPKKFRNQFPISHFKRRRQSKPCQRQSSCKKKQKVEWPTILVLFNILASKLVYILCTVQPK